MVITYEFRAGTAEQVGNSKENWKSMPTYADPDLQNMIAKSLALDHSLMEKSTSLFLGLKPSSVIQALTMSAILLWVFESDWPEMFSPQTKYGSKFHIFIIIY